MEMRLTEKRRALAEIRRRWRESTPDNPLFLCACITDSPQVMSVSNFCLAFEYLHHMKRHEKSLRADVADGVDDEDDNDEDRCAPREVPEPKPKAAEPGAWFTHSLTPDDTNPTRLWAEPTLFPPHFHTAAKRPSRAKRGAAAPSLI